MGDENEEELPYKVIQKFQNYEKRYYPSAKYVCNTTSVDTAADPLAGLERMNPFEVMMSRRFSKTPKSQQFMELFRYIQGVNQNQEEIEMTRPVVISTTSPRKQHWETTKIRPCASICHRSTKNINMMRNTITKRQSLTQDMLLNLHLNHLTTRCSCTQDPQWRYS